MHALPDELMRGWMKRVGDHHRLVVASGVSRLWRSLATSDCLWLPFLQRICPTLAPLGRPLELLRAWTRLQRAPTSPESEAFSFVVELASVTHGVLLSKVLRGNANMSWCLSPGDFVLAPNVATWSSRRVRPGDDEHAAPELDWDDFYGSGVRLLDILEANRFVLTVHAYHEGKLARLINAAEPVDNHRAPNDVRRGPYGGGVMLQFDDLTRYVEEYADLPCRRSGGNLHSMAITRRDVQDPPYPPGHRPMGRELVARTAEWFACDFVSTNFVYSRVDKLLDDQRRHPGFDPWSDFLWPEVTLSLGIFTSGGLAYPAGIVHELLSLESFTTHKRVVEPRELIECFRWV